MFFPLPLIPTPCIFDSPFFTTRCDDFQPPPAKRRRRASSHKVRNALLPPELQLLQFIHNISSRAVGWNETTPGCRWQGVECDREGNVVRLGWNAVHLTSMKKDEPSSLSSSPKCDGKNLSLGNHTDRGLSWSHLPSTIQHINFLCCYFFGPVPTSELPSSLIHLVLSHNFFRGSFDMSQLPAKLEVVRISSNFFSGPFQLAALPAGLDIVLAGWNSFSGSLELRFLPQTLSVLDVGNNKLSGVVSFDSLPQSMRRLGLRENYFEGTADLRQLPPWMEELDLRGNAWKEVVSCPKHLTTWSSVGS